MRLTESMEKSLHHWSVRWQRMPEKKLHFAREMKKPKYSPYRKPITLFSGHNAVVPVAYTDNLYYTFREDLEEKDRMSFFKTGVLYSWRKPMKKYGAVFIDHVGRNWGFRVEP